MLAQELIDKDGCWPEVLRLCVMKKTTSILGSCAIIMGGLVHGIKVK